MKKNIVAIGMLSLAILGGALAVGATALIGSASAQTPTTAEGMVTQDGGGHGLLARFRAHHKEVRKHEVQVTADTIGISTDDLRSELKGGKSIAQVATEHSVDPQAVITAIDNDVNARVAQAVTNNKLSQDKADKITAKAPEIITKIVNHVFG